MRQFGRVVPLIPRRHPVPGRYVLAPGYALACGRTGLLNAAGAGIAGRPVRGGQRSVAMGLAEGFGRDHVKGITGWGAQR
jgi:hypothetical protein